MVAIVGGVTFVLAFAEFAAVVPASLPLQVRIEGGRQRVTHEYASILGCLSCVETGGRRG